MLSVSAGDEHLERAEVGQISRAEQPDEEQQAEHPPGRNRREHLRQRREDEPGPAVGSSPSANTAGKIASPASRPETVSPNVVHQAFAVRLSLSVRYDPYTTMNVPPSDSENIAWPIAATITRGVRSDAWNLRMYHSTPVHRARQRERARDEHDAA